MFRANQKFFILPPSVRQRIYGFLGATRPCTINVLSEKYRLWELSQMKPNPNEAEIHDTVHCYHTETCSPSHCFCPALPIAFTQTCRGIHIELHHLIYGGNKFNFEWMFFGGTLRYPF